MWVGDRDTKHKPPGASLCSVLFSSVCSLEVEKDDQVGDVVKTTVSSIVGME